MSALAAMRAVRTGQAWQEATDRTLQSIDATLEDWDQWDGHSADAARWAGGPEESDWPEPGDFYLDLLRQHRQRAAPAITIAPETQSFVDAMERLVELTNLTMTDWQRRLLELSLAFGGIKRQVEGDTGKSWAYLVQRAERPQASAERTRSPQWRAGTRRTKRQARRRHG